MRTTFVSCADRIEGGLNQLDGATVTLPSVSYRAE